MMTLEDIRNVEFSRGRGYRSEEVDDFIDECVEAMEHLVRENAEVNQKMKALADKVAEYRNDEDSIRAALLSAQRTGDTIIREAEAKAKALLESAQQDADAARRDLLADIEREKDELARVKNEVAQFKSKLLGLYKEHLSLINLLPEEAPEQPAAAEESVEKAPEVIEPQEDDGDMIVVAPVTEESIQENAEEELKPLSRFADLKFGNDYDIHEDDEEESDDDDDQPSRGLFRKKK
ncbi:MAG: DivIVA domain-containing protein [Clostridia bacterium]|nr:DivIVA domain-containing protein [Clostridia bacterium]